MLNKERPDVVEALIKYTMDDINWHSFMVITGCDSDDREGAREWFDSEYVEPFKITKAEKCILEDLYKYSENNGSIMRYVTYDGIALLTPWDVYEMPFYNHLFAWIKEGESYEIKGVLENCEVIKDVE